MFIAGIFLLIYGWLNPAGHYDTNNNVHEYIKDGPSKLFFIGLGLFWPAFFGSIFVLSKVLSMYSKDLSIWYKLLILVPGFLCIFIGWIVMLASLINGSGRKPQPITWKPTKNVNNVTPTNDAELIKLRAELEELKQKKNLGK